MKPALVALFALAFAEQAAHAHDHWIELANSKIYLVVGEAFHDAEPVLIRGKDQYTRFELVSPKGHRDLRSLIREDSSVAAVLPTLEAGTIAIDAAPHDIVLAAEKFQAYLLEERLTDILAKRAELGAEDLPGRERYVRCLKAIVQLGAAKPESVTHPIGQELEVVPLSLPRRGETLIVQVLFHGRPLAKQHVVIANRWHGDIAAHHLRTDADGKAAFAIDRSGDWMVRLVHMEASSQAGADWASWWSSLTFAIAE